MPELMRVEGFRFFFWSNESREPPHVHVARGDGYAKFWLSPVTLAASSDFKPAEMRRIRELVAAHEGLFLERWHEFFGA